MKRTDASPWSIDDSRSLYRIQEWSNAYFSISDGGTVQAHCRGMDLDLDHLVRELVDRGLDTPILLRFADILEHRIRALGEAFEGAIRAREYRGTHRGVYPIKVNQMRQVVEEVLACEVPSALGLEVGSKPELILALSELPDPDRLLVCNGFKDRTYLRLALLATKVGRRCHIVIDRYDELALCLELAAELEMRPVLGLRFRMSSRGAGRWSESSGDNSKFGLSSLEIVQAVEMLTDRGMLDCLQLLHFHLGSQITEIRAIQSALREAGRTYCELVRMGAPMGFLDVGGGLGVDYDGSRGRTPSSKNYSLQEYANDVVEAIQEACDRTGVHHPVLVTESGRASVAHHALLVVDVRGRQSRQGAGSLPVPDPDSPRIQRALYEIHESMPTRVDAESVLKALHDLHQLKEEMEASYSLGYIGLQDRAEMERLYWAAMARLMEWSLSQDCVSGELDILPRLLADTYYCNLSVFQSLPDHWAIDQVFPVLPLHRLDEEPARPAVLADLTCDSDGRIDRFIHGSGESDVLYLHEPKEAEPYYLGIFLVGAYQEVLGDLHNLFGDTHAVHVSVDADGQLDLSKVVEGDTIAEVLSYVQYESEQMIARLRRIVECGLREGRISKSAAQLCLQLYKETLGAQTYLDAPARSNEGEQGS